MDELSMGPVQITACFALQCQDSSVLYLLLLFFGGGVYKGYCNINLHFFFTLLRVNVNSLNFSEPLPPQTHPHRRRRIKQSIQKKFNCQCNNFFLNVSMQLKKKN